MTDSTASIDKTTEAKAPFVRLIAMESVGAPGTEHSKPEFRFGERLRYARDELGLSVGALARLSKDYDTDGQGVSQTSISRYESGERLPGLGEFRVLCDTLEIPSQWLLYGTLADDGNGQIGEFINGLIDARIKLMRSQPEIGGESYGQYVSGFAKRDRAVAIARAKRPKDTP